MLQLRSESGNLHSVVYHCRASRPMSRRDLQAIREASVRNNQRDQITGMLIYGWQQFVQIIEGSDSALMSLLGRITRDDRGLSVELSAIESIETRSYANWSMAVVDLELAGSEARFLYSKMMETLHSHQDAFERVEAVQDHLRSMRRYLDSPAAV